MFSQFTEMIFIRKKTKELIDFVESLGYEFTGYAGDEDEPDILITHYSNFSGPVYSTSTKKSPLFIESCFFDCGENEELFKQLASLRKDTCVNQWFISNEDFKDENGLRVEKGSWFRCTDIDKDYKKILKHYHKATAFEIKNKFK